MSSTVMCRLCLNTNRCSYFINHTVLQETWERLTDATFDSKDGRPLFVCYICCAQLRNSHQLRKRALKAEELFTKYIPNNGFEDSKKLVSFISKTYINDYNYAIEEQYNLEFEQKVPETAEEVKKEIQDDEDINIREEGRKVFFYLDKTVAVKEEELEVDEIAIKEEIEDVIEEDNAENAMDDVKTGILPDYEDTLIRVGLEETTQREVGDLERIHLGVTTKKWNAANVHQTAKHIEVDEAIMERKSVNNTFTCQPKEISATFNQIISLNVHDDADGGSLNSYANDKVFSCKLCKYECFTKRSMNIHLRKQHTEDKACVSNLCDDKASNNDNLKEHVMHEHKHKKEKRLSYYKGPKYVSVSGKLNEHTNEKAYKCDLCDFITVDIDKLRKHRLNKHRKEKNYVCHICEKQFVTKKAINEHLVEHTGDNLHKTADEGNLELHVKLKDIIEKKYECDICQRKFLKKGYLSNHLRIHSTIRPYKCDLCDYRTLDNRNLKQHFMFKHIKQKNYTCHICQKKFVTKSDVNRHLRVHTGEKPFKCDFCGHRTSESGSLKKHLKFKHKM